MFCYIAASEIHAHDRLFIAPIKKKKMDSRANNTDLHCAQALVKKSIKLQKKRKSKLCYLKHVTLFKWREGFTSLKQQKYVSSYIYRYIYILRM